MHNCDRSECNYHSEGKCQIGLDPKHPECSYNAEHNVKKFICANCDFCGKEAKNVINISFQCMVGPNKDKQPETSCFCVCDACKEKYMGMVEILRADLPSKE